MPKPRVLSVRLREVDKDRLTVLAAVERRTVTAVITGLIVEGYRATVGDVTPTEALREMGEAR